MDLDRGSSENAAVCHSELDARPDDQATDHAQLMTSIIIMMNFARTMRPVKAQGASPQLSRDTDVTPGIGGSYVRGHHRSQVDPSEESVVFVSHTRHVKVG